ncbi:MAG TPA: VTT domain-containing protein [Candidatus Acidoferrales bacterium]|nr:VTT domain-containing protein [Candidatus Acidoferrales bacterium]
MQVLIRFLVHHGYSVLFFWVLLEQGGLPIPSIPLLLAAGALAGAHRMSLAIAFLIPVFAATIGDIGWFEFGRRRGGRVLNLICRISLEPDSCARRTEDLYARYGAKSLLFAKFIPGLATVAPPLAGVFRMRWSRFLSFDLLGSAIWSGILVGLGYAFSSQLELVANYVLRLGEMLVVILAGGLAAYIIRKYYERQKFLRDLRIARISPEELKAMLEAGEQIQIVDLRHSMEFEAEPLTIPGALRMDPSELETRQEEIPRDRDVVLYCT